MSLALQCQKIQLILSDVDGVMTDGGVYVDDSGNELMRFHIHDGFGIRLWLETGNAFGIVTGRDLPAVAKRASYLRIPIIKLGVVNKLETIQEIAAESGLSLESICYLGDDLPDLAAMQSVGLGVAVANAAEDLRRSADYVTSVCGGNGAVREVIDLILKNSGRWKEATQSFHA